MPIKHCSSKPSSLRYHLMAKHCQKVGRELRSEAWNLPTRGCKSMMEGPTIMLGVFITLLNTYTMLIKHCSSKPTSLGYHLMAKRCQKVGRKLRSKTWNLPTRGCKSMREGPTIMLGVFITLLNTYTMPIKHCSSKPSSLRYHLMAKRCLKVGSKSEIWDMKPAYMGP